MATDNFHEDNKNPFSSCREPLDISSVADQGCLSRIPDPKPATKERGEKKFIVLPFFVATNITKLKTTLFLK
jgi:hypothetical protein